MAFSYAYVSLEAGIGALLLFGTVQATMILAALSEGERTSWQEWTGLAVALAGLIYLVSPGLAAPPPLGAALMVAAGAAWGVYSLRGRGSGAPVLATAGNFARSAPLALAVSAVVALGGGRPAATALGVALALASGVLASGFGYVLWYAALQHLTAVRAATVQLVVPGTRSRRGDPAARRITFSKVGTCDRAHSGRHRRRRGATSPQSGLTRHNARLQ